jgi:hypothetical protein
LTLIYDYCFFSGIDVAIYEMQKYVGCVSVLVLFLFCDKNAKIEKFDIALLVGAFNLECMFSACLLFWPHELFAEIFFSISLCAHVA